MKSGREDSCNEKRVGKGGRERNRLKRRWTRGIHAVKAEKVSGVREEGSH